MVSPQTERNSDIHSHIYITTRLLIPAKLDGHYKAVCRAFEEGDLTAPSLRSNARRDPRDDRCPRGAVKFTSWYPERRKADA
jgi:hypothetical protein